MSNKREAEHNDKAKTADSSKEEGKSIEEKVLIDKAELDKLKAFTKDAEDYKDKYLRAQAEIDNIRKRFNKEKEEYVKFANEDLLSELLYVIDNFDRAMEHINGTQKVENVIEGIKMIQKEFHRILEARGIERIEALGKEFDPTLHDAVEHVEADEDKDHKIVEEVQAGYMLNGRLLRPAIVKVGKKK
ncbi:MAG: nucleotide exchange factor GrpE [Candidatus Omnitrophica bacterium]|nr:nucleotide exchange factor GrpE [Candidatus Omnitrophota bacterium]